VAVPLADVTGWIIIRSRGQERCEENVRSDVVAHVTVGGRSWAVDNEGMGDDDVGVFPVAEEDATRFPRQMSSGLGDDDLDCLLAQLDPCCWPGHC
jgi:hypothetical protein